MLHEHQVGLLAAFGHERVKAFGELHSVANVALRERRIGDHSVEAADFAILVQVLGFFQRVTLPDIGAADAMQQHIYFADGPRAAVEFLTGEFQVARVAASLLNILLGESTTSEQLNADVSDVMRLSALL